MGMHEASLSARLAAELAARDWVVHPAFLDPGRCAVLRAEAETLRRTGHFRAAGIGQAGERHRDIRGDELLWTEPALTPRAAELMQQELETLRLAVNAATFLGLHEIEAHYAVYPPGAAYARHLDRFQERNQRVVSMALYLNESWEPADGGELRLYPGDGAEGVTVMPAGGTLVCFLSEAMPHEVLPARRLRLSLTGWFRRRG